MYHNHCKSIRIFFLHDHISFSYDNKNKKKKKKRTFHVITPIDTRIPTYLRNETINRHHTRLGYHRENPKNSFINCYHAQIKCTITRHVEKLAGHRTN